MERNRYCGCSTGKLTSRCPTCSGDTWEERAFAEDALGLLGDCVWPPRSYSCSFCRREFRSAQALGGHMNVHRRDRARLRECSPAQASTPNNNEEGSWASRKSHVTAPNYLLSGYLRARSSLSDSLLRRAKVEAALGLTFVERKVGGKDKRGSTSEEEEEEGTTSGYKRVIAVAGLSPRSYVPPNHSLHEGGGLTVSTEDHDVDLELRLGITRKAKFDAIQNIKC